MKPLIILSLIAVVTGAVSGLDVPTLQGRVNDYAGILSEEQESNLDIMLRKTEETSSSQVVLLTIRSLEGDSLEDFSIRVVEAWKLGQKDLDNGVLLLISMEERKIRIDVGYGLEPLLTDAKCGYIIRNRIVPDFKKGDYYAGIHSGLTAITGIINREYDISQEELQKYRNAERKGKKSHFPFGFIFFLVILFLSFLGGGGRRGRGSRIFWTGGFGGGSGGGGFSGGGFSGGGGSFGGGGASGGW